MDTELNTHDHSLRTAGTDGYQSSQPHTLISVIFFFYLYIYLVVVLDFFRLC